jgi:hypothetical protein
MRKADFVQFAATSLLALSAAYVAGSPAFAGLIPGTAGAALTMFHTDVSQLVRDGWAGAKGLHAPNIAQIQYRTSRAVGGTVNLGK